MLDYDVEAPRYDRTRGGAPRAAAAARALAGLLPRVPGVILDLAGGTGSVGAELAGSGRQVIVADRSAGMLEIARDRLPGSVFQADATGLPIRDCALAAVTTVWLLHLLPAGSVRAVLAECARVLAPGGRYLTTVDKSAGGRMPRPGAEPATDARAAVVSLCRDLGLVEVAEGRFVGYGQGGDHPDPVYTVVAFEKARVG